MLPIFGSPHRKKRENTKISKKYIRKKTKQNNSCEKRKSERLENGQKLDEEIKKYTDWNLTVYFFTDEGSINKENSIWGRKIQNQMFKDSINFYWRFNWIYRGFDCKKNCVLSQFGL